MPKNKKTTTKTAFTLMEVMVVLGVISVIVIGIASIKTMLSKAKTAKAVQLTNDSPLQDISQVTLWLESSQNLSFKDEERQDYQNLTSSEQTLGIGSITRWYDRNPHPVDRKNGSAGSISQAPKYYQNGIEGIPALYFDGSSNYLTVDNSTSLTLNDYSIFIVEKKESSSAMALLGSDNNTTDDVSLDIGYDDDTTIYWHQGTSGSAQREYAVTELAGQTHKLHTFINRTNIANDTTAVEYYLNTNLVATSNSGTSVDFSTTTLGGKINIGRTGGASLYQGRIGEIIILPFAVSDSQRAFIEKYLITKWKIPTTAVNPIIIIEIPLA